MNIIKINKQNFQETVSRVTKTIRRGEICILPFDTVYGFVCNPRNIKAVDKIFELKARPIYKALGIATSNLANAGAIAFLKHTDFIKEKIPGKYTFILKAKDFSFASECYKNQTVAIRIPQNDLVLEVADELKAIAQTSANLSGEPSCLSIEELKQQFGESLKKVNLIVDGGEILDGKPSKIWDLTGDAPVEIER